MSETAARPQLPLTSPAAVSVLTRILTHGPIARVDIAKRVGLSQAAVTKVVRPLMADGFVIDVGNARSPVAPGRPSNPLAVVVDRAAFLGLKVTTSEVVGVATDFGAAVKATRRLAIADTNVETVVAAVAGVATSLISELGARAGRLVGVGVAISGDVDAGHGVVRHSPLLGWRQVPLAERLRELLGVSVVVSNDVRALTVAEHWFGAGIDEESFAVVTIGSGIGCGLFLNGDVVAGGNGVSGEIGHLPLAPGDLVCTCGRRGCVETVASSDAILARIRTATRRPDLDLAAAVDLAHSGNRAASQAFDRAGEVIGTALAAMVNLVGPDLVVIAGEGVADYGLYDQRIRAAFAEHAFGAAGACRLEIRAHTFDDWARGAAAVVIRSFVRDELPA